MRFASVALRAARRPALSIVVLTAMATAGLMLSSTGTDAATKYTAFVGGGARGIAVEAFLPSTIFVNEGDSVEFVNPYEEIHTVTFTVGGAIPAFIVPAPGPASTAGPPKLIINPQAGFPTGMGVETVDGTVYRNSGILGKTQAWTVTFPKQGQFQFVCIIHPGMEGAVHVLPAGVHVPNQAQRDFEAQQLLAPQIAAGEASAAAVKPGKTANANGTSTWEVVNPPSVGQADVMRFVPSRLEVGVGDTIVWKNDTFVPHTVTFSSGGPAPELIVPEPQPAGPPQLVIAAQTLFPVKPSQNYEGTGYFNSGFLGVGPEATGGPQFSLTFTKAGTYSYICVLHVDQGMAGVVQVGPDTPAVRPPSTGEAGLAAPSSTSITLLAGLGLASILAFSAAGALFVTGRTR